MNPTVSEHLRRYPNARSSTVKSLIAKEETTNRLRKEVAATRRRERFAWLFRLAGKAVR